MEHSIFCMMCEGLSHEGHSVCEKCLRDEEQQRIIDEINEEIRLEIEWKEKKEREAANRRRFDWRVENYEPALFGYDFFD
ncbi:hypothetical protein FZC84_21110 [Rossellomorea vietnamensis]|uniref:Uncharacterized protein n=1 Tax=Rossellomorea vietnamensis TaxID=218284 RepID=A0A5D4M180_9BACI|nr:hypothetical protein [Rossellomorea vietnamensis]TYR95694.1 hypothetical protein FZC84_21110 [Rossellomorea vietnamensis]